jgi:hypothetical protein
MSISAERDPLDATLSPDRVFYAVGALLGVQDFTDEQTYHRGRLARALSFLSGYGTLTGLKVDLHPARYLVPGADTERSRSGLPRAGRRRHRRHRGRLPPLRGL